MKYLPRYFFLRLIRIYQKHFSPDQGSLSFLHPFPGVCKFQPTCSEYTYQAIKKFGLFKGGFKALWRILRCHPWSKGGWDPIERSKIKNKI